MKSLLRKIFFGDIDIKEYSTVTITGEIKETIFLETREFSIDISKTHWVLCLDPVVFGVWLNRNEPINPNDEKSGCRMRFCDSSGDDLKMTRKNSVAIVTLDYFDKIEEAEGILYLLKLRKSKIHHVSFLKKLVLFFKYYKKPGMSFGKYASLVAAYSYPRRVRIISINEGEYFNIFPMDLLGEIPQSGKYIFGLRHTNVALSKIIEGQKIVVSEVPYIYKDIIYKLGKHHGSSPPSPDSLPFKIKLTENFRFFIPEWADSYKEIHILKTKSLGSHMLLWGEIANEKKLRNSTGNLYHIHFLLYYRQKRKGADYKIV